jgi:hypothetical protein
MNFSFSRQFSTDTPQWEKFDIFLEDLSWANKQEFQKQIYRSGNFLYILEAVSSAEKCFEFHREVPEYIEEQIRLRLIELFPGRRLQSI